MDLNRAAAGNAHTRSSDLGCLGIFDDEISSVLQLISRDGCHELHHQAVAFPTDSVGVVGCSACLTMVHRLAP